MISKLKYVLAAVFLALITLLTVVYFSSTEKITDNPNVDFSVYKPYVLNTEINFEKGGNSNSYIKKENGWGGQEPKWRCSVGKKAEIKLYVKDGKDTALMLHVNGFGVYNYDTEEFQKITVFANDKQIAEWNVDTNVNTYNAKIPADLMKDDTLVLRFMIGKPFVSGIDTRPLGFVVKKVELNKQFANKTKIKMARWIKHQLKDIETPDYKDSGKN